MVRWRSIVTSGTEGEWYASGCARRRRLPLRSSDCHLGQPAAGRDRDDAAEAERGRASRRGADAAMNSKPIVVGTDEPRRVAIVGASGLWRWRFRGGVASDAFTAALG